MSMGRFFAYKIGKEIHNNNSTGCEQEDGKEQAGQGVNMRTDLPIESCLDAAEEITGARWQQEQQEGDIVVSTVCIETEQGARRLGRPQGKYVTLECPHMRDNRLEIHRRIIDALTAIWRDFFKCMDPAEGTVLVIGLGNRQVTADALGPQVVDQILVTRHIRQQLPEEWKGKMGTVAALAPGVMGQTGIETAELITAMAEAIHPSCVVAVDALAAGVMERLVSTVQICDTGIQPGAGMGNRRKEISSRTLGIPVLAVGVPTVMDASGLAQEQPGEAYFVTPKDMDAVLRRVSLMIASSLNRTLHRLTAEELKAYLY